MSNCRLGWFVLSERSIVGDDNNISMINTIEMVAAPVLPAPVQWVFTCYWYRLDLSEQAPITLPIRLIAEKPSGEEVCVLENEVQLTQERLRTRLFVTLILSMEGRYWFRLDQHDGSTWREVGRLPLQVVVASVDRQATQHQD